MAKKKKASSEIRQLPWLLKKNKKGYDLMFLGTLGRFGFVEKYWKDFDLDDCVEFYIAHNPKTRKMHLTGEIPKGYKSPFDSPAPIKPEENEEEPTK